MNENVMKKEEEISVENFSRRVGISRSYAYQLAAIPPEEGGVKSFMYGNKKIIRIPASEVARFKASRERVEA
jgi:hypothetical protein